jgi:hypothetical protein
MSLGISKKKQDEFDKIFFQLDACNLMLNIELFRKLFDSDYYEHFLNYSKNKIEKITNDNIFYLHINIRTFLISDLYYYDKILEFAKLLHQFTDKLLNIYIYESSYIFINLIKMINSSLNFKIDKKLIFDNIENFNSKFNKISIYIE